MLLDAKTGWDGGERLGVGAAARQGVTRAIVRFPDYFGGFRRRRILLRIRAMFGAQGLRASEIKARKKKEPARRGSLEESVPVSNYFFFFFSLSLFFSRTRYEM